MSILKTLSSATRAATFLCALLFLVVPAASAQTAANRVAALEQEVADLRNQNRRLQEEMQDLRNLVARLAAKPPAGTSGSTTQSQIRELAINTDTQLKALEARAKRHTDTRVAALATDVDKALKKQAAEVNAALQGGSGRGSTTGGSGGTSGGTGTGSTTTTPPADVPRTGITYTLKRGDLISSIAAKNKSRVAWILAANNLTEAQAKRLQIGHKLFIPQRQNTPPTPPTDGTPPPPPPAE